MQIRQAALTPEIQGYSTHVNSIDIDSISNEDVQSFLSVDWGGGQKRAKQTPVHVDDPIAQSDLFSPTETPSFSLPLPHPAGTPLPSSLPTLPPAGTPLPSYLQTPPPAGTPLPSSLPTLPPAGTPLPSYLQTLPPAGTLLPSSLPTLPPAGTPLPSYLQTLPPAGTPLPSSLPTLPPAGTPLPSSLQTLPPAGILLSELGLSVPSLSGYSPLETPLEEGQTGVSTARSVSTCSLSSIEELNRIPKGDIAADVVMTAFMQRNNNTLDINNVGRLGVLLARYTFFGDDILQDSTLKGKGKRPGLDKTVIDLLMSTIHNRHPFSLMSATEFRTKIRPKVERALTDFLKPKPKRPPNV